MPALLAPWISYTKREIEASVMLAERNITTTQTQTAIRLIISVVSLIITAAVSVVIFIILKKKKARKLAFQPQFGVIQPAPSKGQTGFLSNISKKMPFGKGAGTHQPNESASNIALMPPSQYPPQPYAPLGGHGYSEGYAEHKPYDPPPGGYMMPPPPAGSGFGQGPQPNNGQPPQQGFAGHGGGPASSY